jgi:hypothetical protein
MIRTAESNTSPRNSTTSSVRSGLVFARGAPIARFM